MKRVLLVLCALLGMVARAQQIDIARVEGFNLQIIGRPSATVVEVKPSPPVHNWFAAKFINLPVGQAVQIRVNMTGCDTTGNVANTAKWQGLRPVYTYADPTKYETYEWYRKDAQGRWTSGDLFKEGTARLAGTAKTPAQTAISAALAPAFLSADQTFWYPWQEIEGAKADTATRTFTITVKPAAATMTIAMHVPYLLSFERELIKRLQAAHFPGVFVDELALSAGNRPLYFIRVDDPLHPAPLQITSSGKPPLYKRHWGNKDLLMTNARPEVRLPALPADAGERRVMLLDAREHPSEQNGSWVVLGALKALLADAPETAALRKDTTWLLLPIYDPDGVANAEYDTRTDAAMLDQSGGPESSLPEALAYFSYLRAFPNAGYCFATAATFYSLECTDGLVVCCPYANMGDGDRVIAFNRFWYARCQAAGIPAGPEAPWSQGWLPFRLATGCSTRYKALGINVEVNDRYPNYRLTLEGLEQLGASYVQSLTEWLPTPEGAQAMKSLRTAQQARQEEQAVWQWGMSTSPPDHPSLYELLVPGY